MKKYSIFLFDHELVSGVVTRKDSSQIFTVFS
jgi:hypothetical protein